MVKEKHFFVEDDIMADEYVKKNEDSYLEGFCYDVIATVLLICSIVIFISGILRI